MRNWHLSDPETYNTLNPAYYK